MTTEQRSHRDVAWANGVKVDPTAAGCVALLLPFLPTKFRAYRADFQM
jgi:hypothetical protein